MSFVIISCVNQQQVKQRKYANNDRKLNKTIIKKNTIVIPFTADL